MILILAWIAFQSKLFSIMTPPKQPHHSPLGLLEWKYQEGEGGLIKVKKTVDF